MREPSAEDRKAAATANGAAGAAAAATAATAAAITKSPNRRLLFHFTRAGNLPAIAHFDTLLSSSHIHPETTGGRRTAAMKLLLGPYAVTVNAQLRIPDAMMDAGVTQAQFRAYLDRHVFLWPTLKDCRKMMETYARREPDERFAVLALDAYALLSAHADAVKLSKYDSGSAPRYPHRCAYRKGPAMFVPLNRFALQRHPGVPATPSDIREVLVEDRVTGVSACLRTLYADHPAEVPDIWRGKTRPLADLLAR